MGSCMTVFIMDKRQLSPYLKKIGQGDNHMYLSPTLKVHVPSNDNELCVLNINSYRDTYNPNLANLDLRIDLMQILEHKMSVVF